MPLERIIHTKNVHSNIFIWYQSRLPVLFWKPYKFRVSPLFFILFYFFKSWTPAPPGITGDSSGLSQTTRHWHCSSRHTIYDLEPPGIIGVHLRPSRTILASILALGPLSHHQASPVALVYFSHCQFLDLLASLTLIGGSHRVGLLECLTLDLSDLSEDPPECPSWVS